MKLCLNGIIFQLQVETAELQENKKYNQVFHDDDNELNRVKLK